TLYGDLAVSTLDELPPGRTPITTELCRESRRERVYGRIRGEIAAGHQAYIVYPLVEESEKSALRAATTMLHELGAGPLAGLRLGLVHGRLKADEKDEVMRAFKAGDYDVLVSTTVIEVGIDVPNATAIVIERAARDEALAWLAEDPDLSRPESAALRAVLVHRWKGRLGLARVG